MLNFMARGAALVSVTADWCRGARGAVWECEAAVWGQREDDI